MICTDSVNSLPKRRSRLKCPFRPLCKVSFGLLPVPTCSSNLPPAAGLNGSALSGHWKEIRLLPQIDSIVLAVHRCSRWPQTLSDRAGGEVLPAGGQAVAFELGFPDPLEDVSCQVVTAVKITPKRNKTLLAARSALPDRNARQHFSGAHHTMTKSPSSRMARLVKVAMSLTPPAAGLFLSTNIWPVAAPYTKRSPKPRKAVPRTAALGTSAPAPACLSQA